MNVRSVNGLNGAEMETRNRGLKKRKSFATSYPNRVHSSNVLTRLHLNAVLNNFAIFPPIGTVGLLICFYHRHLHRRMRKGRCAGLRAKRVRNE